jgi:UPF0716 protein FxsA
MFPLLFVLFILVPIAELYVIIQVGQQIGAGWTILLLVADSVLGSLLLRSQGRTSWRRFNETLAAGRVPGREVADGAMIILGGALLLTPGFITDIFGILLLLPPSRAVIRRVLVRRVAGRVTVAGFGTRRRGPIGGPGPPRADPRPRPRSDYDVEGTATDHDPGELPR